MGVHTVKQFMSSLSIFIDSTTALKQALDLMSVNRFNYLPVVSQGRPVGVLSQRDLRIAQSLPGVDPELIAVGDIAKNEVMIVGPDDDVKVVAEVMAKQRLGSALVLDGASKVVGIFTAIDALNAICHIN